jgi:glutathione reductase (NADPH)
MAIVTIVADIEANRVPGVHILGEDTAEMAQLLAIANMGAEKAEFDRAMVLRPAATRELVTLCTRTACLISEVARPKLPECGSCGAG